MTRSISPTWSTPTHLVTHSEKVARHHNKQIEHDFPVINSPLLFDLFNSLPDKKHTILDIAQANTQSLSFYNNYHCKIHLSNSLNEFAQLSQEQINTPTKWHRTLVKNMGFYKRDHVGLDAILLWGLPNYLNSEQLNGLLKYLLPQSTDHCYLHMYIYNSEKMSEYPSNYRIYSDNKVLVVQQKNSAIIKCPGYNLRHIEKLLNPFKLEHSVMLSSGIQEYLFQLP